MKTIILKVVFITLVTLGLNGCYTIIWSPDSQLPTEDNSVTNIYYGDNYYGDYYYFYDTPWWWDYSYNPPVTGVTRPGRDEGTQPLRDLGEREEHHHVFLTFSLLRVMQISRHPAIPEVQEITDHLQKQSEVLPPPAQILQAGRVLLAEV